METRLASNTAGSGRGSWYIAHAKALSVALSSAPLPLCRSNRVLGTLFLEVLGDCGESSVYPACTSLRETKKILQLHLGSDYAGGLSKIGIAGLAHKPEFQSMALRGLDREAQPARKDRGFGRVPI
jgi:hypothetical protein